MFNPIQLLAQSPMAQDPIGTLRPPSSRIITSADPNTNLANLVTIFLGTATVIGGLVFMVMLILGGLQWLMSGGDKAGLEQARGRIVNAAIGLGLIVGAVAIAVVVQTALGISILQPRLPTL